VISLGIERMRGFARAAFRVCWLATEILRGAAAWRGSGSLEVRARWLHQVCRRALRIFSVKVSASGRLPASGLLVANHLSYLDIILLGSLQPCVFVAKSEIRRWPVFGWFARMAGTIFVDRKSRYDAARAGEAIRAALRQRLLVVLFAEGTSSNGSVVLPFKSPLLESVIGQRIPVSVAGLQYKLPAGDAGAEVCYWGDHTLVPHLFNLLSKRVIMASAAFAAVSNTWRDRKKLAAQLHSEVTRLHAGLAGPSSPRDRANTNRSAEKRGRAGVPASPSSPHFVSLPFRQRPSFAATRLRREAAHH
jgi:1-acyl-sn-glycerol-3-phosphate acyltransferase